ncbi:universal stress protein [Roseovarius sp. D22-M7]|uniref:universal stress protein n=1 Tax=Roseovarius sp. D22-M7 TaxID=3127116 RepID=UPI0030103767
MKHVFVATDGSDTAMKAIDMAAEMAAKFDVPLTVGHVLQFARPSAELARMAEIEHLAQSASQKSTVDFRVLTGHSGDLFSDTRPSGDVVTAITAIGDEIVHRADARARELGVREVDTMTEQGDPADAILDMATSAGADVIVVGHRGLGRLKSLLLGSVAQKVLQHADCTVISVR